MSAAFPSTMSHAPLSRLVAEALVGRHGPEQIARRASEMGLPAPAARIVVKACAACSSDGHHVRRGGGDIFRTR